MPATITAPIGASRTLIPFAVKLRAAGYSARYVALARSSADALGCALEQPGLQPPIAVSVRPVGTSADARRVAQIKLTIADLVS